MPRAEGCTEAAESPSSEINRPVEGNDPRWAAALSAFAEAQRAFDLAHRSNRVPARELARVYQARAEAFNLLAQLAPLDTPVPFIRGLFVAATADAETAREYERRAGRAGEGR